MKLFSLPTLRLKKGDGDGGFTLLELLIVIGIIGILAVGLLAALDPLEQLRKGRDANKKQIAVEYVQAIVRYNATQGTPPWTTAPSASTLASLDGTVTDNLITASELKSSFKAAAANVGTALIVTANASDDVVVCFDPESKNESVNWQQLYKDNAGATAGDSATCTATGTCYFCVR